MTNAWNHRLKSSAITSAVLCIATACSPRGSIWNSGLVGEGVPNDSVAGNAPATINATAGTGAAPSALPPMQAGGATAPPPALPSTTQPSAVEPPQTQPPPPPPPPPASPNWISYGNGAKNHFYNPAETTISVETAPQLKQLWSIQLGEVTGAPAVVAERMYVLSNAGLFALDTSDGGMLWRANISGTSAPFYDEATHTLYVTGSGATLNAVDAMTGAVSWSERISSQSGATGWSSPIVSGNLVVVGVSSMETMARFKGAVAAFDKQTGARQWESIHCTTAGASVWSGPGADDAGVIYATTGNNYVQTDGTSDAILAIMPGMSPTPLWLRQLTMNDGWTFSGGQGGDHDFGANPIILDFEGHQLLAAGQKSGEFHLLDRTTGTPLAKQKLSSTTNQATGGILNNGAYDGKNNLLIAAANEGLRPGKTVAMEVAPDKQLNILWTRMNTGIVWAPITTANGVCFVPETTTMTVLDCKTGVELNTFSVPATIGSGAAISNGRAYFGSGFSYPFGNVISGRNLIAIGLE